MADVFYIPGKAWSDFHNDFRWQFPSVRLGSPQHASKSPKTMHPCCNYPIHFLENFFRAKRLNSVDVIRRLQA